LFHLIHISAKNPQLFSPKAPDSTSVFQTICGVLIRRAAYFDLAIAVTMSAPRDQQKELKPWTQKYLNPQAWHEEKLSQRRYELIDQTPIEDSKKRTLNKKQLCYELESDRKLEKKKLILM
jgi:DNA polymerase I-like protein with 3'-5' exonuclease and polymerase domains